MKTKTLIITLCFLALSKAYAAPLKDMPGSIPLQSERQASSDLVYQGKVLLPDEARALLDSGKIQDLSTLNPDETSVLWKNTFINPPVNDLAILELEDSEDEVEFISEAPVPSGTVGFIGQKRTSSGQLKTYQFLLNLKGHNVLLRKALLRKIGYQIPATERLASLRVRFKGAFSKQEFFKTIHRKTFIESERWVTSNPETDDAILTLQDVVVLEGPDDQMYNLARGDMDSGVMQGRRLFNALLIPFSMTDAPESINLMSWTGGQIFNTQLLMPYEDAEAFSTSYEDARWITRRMLRLSRNEWAEVAAAARMPTEVTALVTEKLISRRNFLRKTLHLENESQEIVVNPGINLGAPLVSGKLKDIEWPGYARHFAGVDPDSPLSGQEVVGLFKSKGLSAVIANTILQFNTRFAPGTDLGWKIFDHQLDSASKQFAHFIATKEVKKTPLGFWSTPFFNTNVIAGRDIIAGSYLGTENRVQLADTVGLAVDAGLFFLGEGLPTAVTVSSQAKISFVKTYTHVKPLGSIAMGLKEPFRNMMVPFLKREAAQPLDQIAALETQKSILSAEEMDQRITTELAAFNKSFGTGESLIVSTSLGPDLSFTLGKGISENAQAYARIQDKLIGIHRVHIYRKDEKTVQVYMDPAFYNIFSLAFGLKAYIPIIEIGWDWQKGMASTYFFDFNIDKDLASNPKFFENIIAISAALKGADLKYLKSQVKPWEVQHDFSDKQNRFQFLVWRFLKANTRDVIRVTHPNGQTADFIRRTRGSRNGRDYEALLTDVTNALIAESSGGGQSVIIPSNKANDPANTLLGKSVARQVMVEAELTPKSIRWDNLFSSVQYTWKGWEIKRDKAEKILNDVEKMFGRALFPKIALNDTQKIQFYSIEVNISLYQQALERVANLNATEIRQIFAFHLKNQNNAGSSFDGWANSVVINLNKLKKALAEGDRREVVDRLTDVLEVAESQLDFEGFKVFVGGQQNMFVRGQIRGFRVGAEDATQEVQSITLGQIGSFEPFGPLTHVQRNMNIASGEFFISWLLNPL